MGYPGAISGSQSVGIDGKATVFIKVPGVFANGDVRLFVTGSVFFDTPGVGDKIIDFSIVDVDNVTGMGANTVLANFTEAANMDSSNQGWFIPPIIGLLSTQTITSYNIIKSGLYIKITGKKGIGILGTFYVNISWRY